MNCASQSKDLIFGSVQLGESCVGMANHSHERRVRKADPFLLNYNAADLKIASEFLSNWLPFLSRGLCRHCTRTLSDRVRSLDTENHVNGSTKHEGTRPSSSTNTVVNGYSKHVDTHPSSSTNMAVNGSSKHEDTRPSSSTNMVVNGSSKHEDTHPSSSTNMVVNGSSKHGDTRLSSSTNMAVNGFAEGHDDCDTNSLGSWNDSRDVNDTADTNSIGSWKDSADGCSQLSIDTDLQVATRKKQSLVPGSVKSPMVRMSWADMAQEDELEAEDECNGPDSEENNAAGDTSSKEIKPKSQLSREQRELIRFNNVQRKKDFICLEHVNGKLVNILDGLELHAGVFSAAEQKRIVQYVEELREKGQNGQLKERTYTAPQKWMKGKGRVTIQFGCCYNYAMDRNGNPPGILKNGLVDPIPHLLKVMIKRMVSWHVLPPTCVPDSCIINIYEEGDCIPPHIDNLEFVRPFCTVSFLSECNIVFGSNLKIIGPGEFTGAYAIPLPLGSVLVLNGNGADVAKHCVPAVPTKRISITFRRMDESKRPNGYIPEPDLQGLQPLSFEADSFKESNSPKPSVRFTRKQPVKREVREESNTGKVRGGYTNRSSESRQFSRVQQQPGNWRRV